MFHKRRPKTRANNKKRTNRFLPSQQQQQQQQNDDDDTQASKSNIHLFKLKFSFCKIIILLYFFDFVDSYSAVLSNRKGLN